MKIKLYKTLSDSADEIEVLENKKICDVIKDVNFDKSLIFCNGKLIDRSYIIRRSDNIFIRSLPLGGFSLSGFGNWIKDTVTNNDWVENALIATSILFPPALSITLPVLAGYKSYKKMEELQRLMAGMSSVSKNTNKDDIENLPFLRGASNSIATGKSQPYIMGTRLFTPYILNSGGNNYKGFSLIEGDKGKSQFYHVVLEGGFANQVIKKIYCDDVTLKKFDDSTIQTGRFNFDNSIFASNNSFFEIAQNNIDFTYDFFKKKIVEEIAEKKLEHADGSTLTPLYFTLAKNTMALNIQVAYMGLLKYNSSGSRLNATSNINVEYSYNYFDSDSPTWYTLATPSYTDCSLTEIRYNIPFNFENDFETVIKLENPICIKITDLTEDLSDLSNGRLVADCYVKTVQSTCYNVESSKKLGYFVEENIIGEKERSLSTLIGVKIESTTDNEDKLKSIQVISSGVARTWNKINKTWSTQKTETSNPASWLLEVLTTNAHTPSQITDNEIDLNSFGDWYEFCENKKLSFNYIVTQGIKKDSLLDMITTVGHGSIYQNIYGKIAVAIDDLKENAIAIFNEQNIVSLKTDKEMTRQPDGVKITYIDEAQDYQNNSIIVMYDNSDPNARSSDSIIKEINVDGITNYEQAYRHCLYIMRCAKLRPHKMSLQVGKEAIYYKPLEKVLVQHPSLKIGLGSAEIKKIITNQNKIIGFELYEDLDLDLTNNFNIIVNCVSDTYSTVQSYAIYGANGKTKEIALKTPISLDSEIVPKAHNILSYGYELETVTRPYLISSIAPSTNGYALELVNYDPRIFDTSDEIPDYITVLTQPRKNTPTAPTMPTPTLDDIKNLESQLKNGTAETERPDNIKKLEAIAKENEIEIKAEVVGEGLKNVLEKIIFEISKDNGENWINIESSNLSTNYAFNREVDGYKEANEFSSWKVRAKTQNIYKKQSAEYVVTSINTDFYGSWLVTQPNINVRTSNRTITLVCTQKERADSRQIYGLVKYAVQVKKINYDDKFYKPNLIADPYLDGEDCYKIADDEGYINFDEVYIQTMPLSGQDSNNIIDTSYIFNVWAFNEATTSTPTQIVATALCDSIRDIVKANENYKKLYVDSLSAISANLGVIKQGSLTGSDSNYWALSTLTDDLGQKRYQGAMRVGGTDEFLEVIPVVNAREQIQGYKIKFQVGNFSVTSEASSINGELVIQGDENSLDRTRITPQGTFYEHRNSLSSFWEIISKLETRGLLSQFIYSNKQLILTNCNVAKRRELKHDIGRLLLSDNSKIYHFDTDKKDQNGEVGYTLDYDIEPTLEGADDTQNRGLIDFTPAILAVAPYSEIGKSLYGQYTLTHPLGLTSSYTVDFWIQYIWAENQTLFSVGSNADKIEISILTAEPNFNEPIDDEPPFNTEQVKTDELTFNVSAGAGTMIIHSGQGKSESIRLDEAPFNIDFESNTWLHFAVILTADEIKLFIQDKYKNFERYNKSTQNAVASFNLDKNNSFILDELLIDSSTAESFDDFKETTQNRIPFGHLNYKNKNFIIDVDDTDNLSTNIFDSELFKQAVKNIINEGVSND